MNSEVGTETPIDVWRKRFHKSPEFGWKLMLESDGGGHISYQWLQDKLKEWVTFVIKNEFDLMHLNGELAKHQVEITSQMFPRHPTYMSAIPNVILQNQLEILEKRNQEAWHMVFYLKKCLGHQMNMATYVCPQGKCLYCKPERPPKQNFPPKQVEPSNLKQDARELLVGKGYTWRDWSMVRDQDSVTLWTDAVALGLCETSNGWLDFFCDGKMTIMFSNGSFDKRCSMFADSFMEKLQKAHKLVPKNNTTILPVFTHPNQELTIKIGDWNLICTKDGELSIFHSKNYPGETIILKENLPGFVRSYRRTLETYTAISVSPELPAGWNLEN